MPLIQICQSPPENGFVYDKAWFSLCHFAFTGKGDPWMVAIPEKDYCPCPVSNVWKGAVIVVTPWGITEFSVVA